jgi:hypothetical protein
VLAWLAMWVSFGVIPMLVVAFLCGHAFFTFWPHSPLAAVIYGFVMALVAGAVGGLAFAMAKVGRLLLQDDGEPFVAGRVAFTTRAAGGAASIAFAVRFFAIPRIPMPDDPEVYIGLVIVPVIAVALLVALIGFAARLAPWQAPEDRVP